ncbi:MAG: TolC family protein, partial [bacterium]
LLPTFTLDANIGKNYQQPTVITIPGMGSFSTTPDEAATVKTYSLTLNQLLFTAGGKMSSIIKVAADAEEASLQDLRKTESDVTFNVQSAYYGVLKAEKMVGLVGEQMDNLRKHLSQVKRFHEAGFATQSDVMQVETALANGRQGEIMARNGSRLAKLAFNSILSRKLTDDANLSDEVLNTDTKAVNKDKLLELAYKNRPDWKAFELAVGIAGEAAELAGTGYWPNVALMGSIGRMSSEYPGAGTSYDLGNWKAFVAGSWTLFDSFNNQNKYAEARANKDALEEQRKSVRDGVELEVTSAYFDLEAGKERIAAAEEAVNLAQRALRYAEISYAARAGTSLAVLDAEVALNKAETDLWNAKYDVETAKAKINKVTGTAVY